MADDGNPETEPVEDWEAISGWSSSPEYPSGLTAASTTAARILEHWFGEDTGFEVTVQAGGAGEEPSALTREYDSFEQARTEARNSRMYSGRHYEYSLRASEQIGNNLAPLVLLEMGQE